MPTPKSPQHKAVQVTDANQYCQRKMKFTLDNGTAEYRITAYHADRVLINGEAVAQSIIISPSKTDLWPPASMDALAESDLQLLLEYAPEILILGTGQRQRFPDTQLLRPLIQAGIGLEVMDSAAACRTYNVLMSENRQVVAGIIIEPTDSLHQ